MSIVSFAEPSRALPRAAPSRTDPWSCFVYLLIAAGFAWTTYYQLHWVVRDVMPILARHRLERVLAYPSLVWTAMGIALLIFRSCVWALYRPFPSVTRDEAPTITVAIPAYNEGAMVLKAIQSIAEADYPHDRLEIIAIDDGSKDDTWDYICEGARRYPGLVTPVRQDRNRGKREALALAFARAKGEFVVTVDSDSVIERDALLAIVGPFRDKRVGAVAGKVLVYNRMQGIIPRMLHVRFVLSFDLLRSAESSYGNVFCCPGALTALRRDAVERVAERWLKQRFLGAPCTFGEDRAMTNLLLGEGYDTVYQRSAVVHTEVPLTYGKLCKMLLRWDRSNVREEIRYAAIVWRRPPWKRLIALADRIVTNLRYPIQYATLALLPGLAFENPRAIMRLLLAMGLVATLNMLYCLKTERSLEFLYGVLYAYFSLFALFWIFPYAVVSVRARSWLTR